jgi:uncharacterized membrane protein
MSAISDSLQRWVQAGVIDQTVSERILAFEASRERPAGLRWQVLLALIFGAILVAAGVILFVAAHWDELSPSGRFTITMAMLIVLHVGGLLARPRFDRLAIALHGVGTIAAGGAIALVGQIFNIQEHWPAAILLWAVCALAGWALLGDQVQQTISLLLLPTWIICEWSARTDGYRGSELFVIRMLTVFAAVYLTAFLGEKKKLVFGVLFAAGCVGVVVGTTALTNYYSLWSAWQKAAPMPLGLLIFLWLCITALPLLFAWRFNRASVLPVAVGLGIAILLPHLYAHSGNDERPIAWVNAGPALAAHMLVALAAAFLTWWGVQQRSRAIINYGVVCFALAVLWFYFSSVMDKLERSFSLMMLGVLFLGGGWILEKARRRLVHQVEEAA